MRRVLLAIVGLTVGALIAAEHLTRSFFVRAQGSGATRERYEAVVVGAGPNGLAAPNLADGHSVTGPLC